MEKILRNVKWETLGYTTYLKNLNIETLWWPLTQYETPCYNILP